jgi:hypothetical protein
MVISSKLPSFWLDLRIICEEMICCWICFAVVLYIGLFVCMGIILEKSNNELVKTECRGFWEFMVVSLLSPVLIPILYVCCGFVFFCVWNWSWKFFSGVCMILMGTSTLYMAMYCTERQECKGALTNSTPPVPWLLYAAYVKVVFFFCGSLTFLRDYFYHGSPKKL